ncbi:MAG: dihydroorotate dehydrogenase electron transfer subunit [Paludibacteraceae bacterium]|nr:dihydroorotate dehydrogenase electron transfer subunit [Paludibacteraceae bacterium]
MAQKSLLDCVVVANTPLSNTCFQLQLRPVSGTLPAILPGQFVEVRVDHTPTVILRRPISVFDVDFSTQTLSLLIQKVGDGTIALSELSEGAVVNLLLPLGNGFSTPEKPNSRLLLVGGGVGVAPLLYLGRQLRDSGHEVNFLLGFRSVREMIDLSAYRSIGNVYVTTEDGSEGETGFVTNHSILKQKADHLYVCGPSPMMKAVAAYAVKAGVSCEVSLENKMACGLGACLCCVTDTKEGHKCVCTEGPVFNINQLKWQI